MIKNLNIFKKFSKIRIIFLKIFFNFSNKEFSIDTYNVSCSYKIIVILENFWIKVLIL